MVVLAHVTWQEIGLYLVLVAYGSYLLEKFNKAIACVHRYRFTPHQRFHQWFLKNCFESDLKRRKFLLQDKNHLDLIPGSTFTETVFMTKSDRLSLVNKQFSVYSSACSSTVSWTESGVGITDITSTFKKDSIELSPGAIRTSTEHALNKTNSTHRKLPYRLLKFARLRKSSVPLHLWSQLFQL